MYTDTNLKKNWSPLLPLALTGAWLAIIALIAVMIGSGCGGSATPPPVASGSITLTWSITDQSGRPATCAQAGAQSVALRLRDRASGDVVAAAFPCESSPGTADAAAGIYDISIELHASDGQALATTTNQTGVRIVAGQVSRLSPVTFAVNTQTTVVLSIAAPRATNCQAPGANGAGITGVAITLERAQAGCAAVTFARTLGATQRGTYTVDCSSPHVASCIEKTEMLTTNLEAGTYTIHVRGKLGATDCWQRDDTFVVPPHGPPLIRTLGLVQQTTSGC